MEMAHSLHRQAFLAQGAFKPHSKGQQRTSSMRLAAGKTAVLRELAEQVTSKQRSAVEVTTAYLNQLRSVEDRVCSFLTVNEEHALAQVRCVAHQPPVAAGALLGPAVSDQVCLLQL